MKPMILIASSRPHLVDDVSNLADHTEADVHCVDDLKQLSTKLASGSVTPQLILIDHMVLHDEHVSLFDFGNTVTLLSSLHQVPCAKLAVMIDGLITKEKLTQVLDAHPFGVVDIDDVNMLKSSASAMLQGHRSLSRTLILSVLKSKKTEVKKAGPSLTGRQQQVLSLICSNGVSNKVIARSLKISESTVKLHISSILKKYGVRNRTQLAIAAQNSGAL
jgi:DNA-binding NarL/FixJ family response regulator